MQKFNTAEEFKALSEEDRLVIVRGIASEGYKANALHHIQSEEERKLYKALQDHYKRIEKLAYAIGDELKAYRDSQDEGSDEWESADEALLEFMASAAKEVEQNYAGEYYDHEDGFWVASIC
jgi:hypothetical protein